VVIPVVLMFPVQGLVLGPAAIPASIVALVCGWVFVEILMKDWGRIPFTCAYIPGKGFVPQTIVNGFVSFVLFTTLGAALAQSGLRAGNPRAWLPIALVAAAALILRRRRLIKSRHVPLAFEDELPTEINPLRLSQ
jgi:hypothetical protein